MQNYNFKFLTRLPNLLELHVELIAFRNDDFQYLNTLKIEKLQSLFLRTDQTRKFDWPQLRKFENLKKLIIRSYQSEMGNSIAIPHEDAEYWSKRLTVENFSSFSAWKIVET